MSIFSNPLLFDEFFGCSGNNRGPSYDPDGAAYATSVGSTTPRAESDFVVNLKDDAVWGDLSRLYLLGHADATKNKTDIKTLATPGSFTGTSHNAGYVTFAGNGYFDFVEAANSVLSGDSHSFGAWIKNAPLDGSAMGVNFSGFNNFYANNFGIAYYRGGNDTTAGLTATPVALAGLHALSRATISSADTLFGAHSDGTTYTRVVLSTTITGGSMATASMLLGALNNVGTPVEFTNESYMATYLSGGLTEAKIAALGVALKAYFTAKGW